MGRHTLDAGNTNLEHKDEGVELNRELFIGYAMETKKKVMNTWFEKPNDKKITYRDSHTQEDHHGSGIEKKTT